ncbi:MAG: M36 family metallopeptidase [Arcicella sp.]|nr:M36 family metallopeptidase [Arcicella sp.]
MTTHAQSEINTAKTYLLANASKEKLAPSDVNDMSISSAYLSPTTGWYHIYFNQTYQDIEVYNALLNVTLKDGQVIHTTHSFIYNITAQSSSVNTTNAQGTLSAVQAIGRAAQHLNLSSSGVSKIQESVSTLSSGAISKGKYLDKGLSNENIDVKLYWLPYEDAVGEEVKKPTTKLALTYSVRIPTKDGQNIWNVHVDVNTGNILRQVDEVIHCDFGVPNKDGISHTCKENHPHHSHPNQGATNRSLVAPNEYNVFDYPLESPNHGGRTVVASPYTRFVPAATGPGTTNGWHNDGTTDYTTTRGNNVFAKEDKAADNETTIGASPTSATLEFNFPYTQATNTAAGNLDAAITNLFYWNNVMHDILWRYGFDEPSGNFQKDNLGRGGAGNDFVFADAQDGSGTNNANFSTPADGTNGRMQMFIWSNAGSPTYQPDSDFDNGIIAHEYGHGWSTRLTGGPANSSCLQNAEQGGEGWSDYAALMIATDWSALTPTLASANIPRGIGTYAIGQPITGAGIRPFRYSYDKATYNNPVTYAGVNNSITFSQPHGIGSIWATMLWDMTWEIILQDGLIGANNIYDVPANIADYRGNVAAMKLVNEGLRLQPCSPSFVQARDAIFKADQLLFNGRYRCAIGKAFARRGLGFLASSGTSTNDRIVKEDFTEFPVAPLSSPTTFNACSGQPVNYTITTAQTGTFNFSWTRTSTSGISNPPASGTGTAINEILINTTNNPVTVQYVISANQVGGANPGCSQNALQSIFIVVNPAVTPSSYSVCQNAAVPSGEGLSVAAATTVTSINGSITTTSPTYVRPNGNNITTYAASPYNVLYRAYQFVASTTGSYTFTVTAATLAGQGTATNDTYMSLYQNSFDPANPATNFVYGNDDISGTVFRSAITANLTAGTPYIIVVSGWLAGVTGTFTVTSNPGIALQSNQWYSAPTGGSPLFTGRIFNPVGVVGSGIPNTSTLGTTTFYVNDINISGCRYPANFTVGSVAGTVSSSTSVCSVSNSGTLTLSGHSGTIVRWESSTDNFVSNITSIANTTTTLSYSNITQTTSYRAVVQTASCDPANSIPATITVNNTTVAGSITGASSVCAGTNSGTLILAGYTGNILNWESSTDNFANVTSITNTTNNQIFTNLTQTTQYRAVVQNGSCTASTTAPVTITVSTLQGGSITGGSTECAFNATVGTINSGTLLLSGHTGNIIRWELSTDNFATSSTIANTGTIQVFNNLTQTTSYRAVIGLSGCANVNSTPTTINVDPVAIGGSVTSNASIVCLGTPVTLTLSGQTGTVSGWQISNNFFASASSINNTNTSITSTPNQSVVYRAVISSGVCPPSFSSPVGILVTPVPTLSAPTVTQPNCNTPGSIVVNATGLGSTIINGSLATGDAAQTNRLTRNGVTSGCGTPKANPGVTTATGIIFDKYTFTNPSASPVCISVTLQAANGVNMLAVLYSTHSATNPSTGYLADFGSSASQTTFRHTVAGNATVDLVVSSTTSNVAVLGAYTLSIDGLTPIQYSVNNGTTWQTSNTFNNLAAGTYNVLARSAPTNINTCSVSLGSNPVSLVSPCTDVISIKTGNWEVANTWNVNRIPTNVDDVTVDTGHTVTITTNNAKAKSVALKANAILNYLNSLASLMLGN